MGHRHVPSGTGHREGGGLSCPTFETQVVGLEAGPVATWSGFGIVADQALADMPARLDLLYLGSATPENQARLAGDSRFARGMSAIASAGSRIVAVGSAAPILGHVGLLRGRRGSSQSRLPAALVMQIEASDRFDGMLQWLTENLHVQVRVVDLADLAGMRPRNFARRFVARTGTMPVRFVGRCAPSARGT